MTEISKAMQAHKAWLASASPLELDAVLSAQLAEDPGLLLDVAAALRAELQPSWTVDIQIGSSISDDSAYVEVPLDQEAFLEAMMDDQPVGPALVRLNVKPDDLGSWLQVDVVLQGTPRKGLRVRAEYALEGEDVVLTNPDAEGRFSATSRTSQRLNESDAVSLRLVVENEEVA